MRQDSYATLARRLAGLAIIFLALIPSAAYFLVEYAARTQRLAHDAQVQAFLVSKLVARNPDSWRFAAERIAAAVAEVHDAQSHSSVLDVTGQELASVGEGGGRFRISRRATFHDFGEPAGEVVVSGSLQRALGVSAMLAGAGVLLGLMLLVVLRKQVFNRLDRAENELRQSNDQLRISAIAFQAAEGLMITNAHRVILQVNPVFAAATGYAPEELMGQTPRIFDSGQQPAALFEQMWQTIAATGAWEGEILSRRKNGEIYPARITVTAVRGEDGRVTHYVQTHADISAAKAAERARLKLTAELEELVRQLTVAKNEAEAANRAKSEFLGSMSHELRTPLNAVLGFSQLLALEPGLDAGAKDQIHEIEHAGQHLLALVNDMIDLARIESGNLEIVLAPVPVSAVMADSLSMVTAIARKHRVTLLNAGEADAAGLAVLVDYVRLRQVLINLLSNAIKYNRPEGSVRLACRLQGADVCISVADTGPGIPQDLQARLFTAFDRLGAECGAVEGTGIGLVITRRLVENMGGTMGFESVEGQGSTFWVRFPLAAS